VEAALHQRLDPILGGGSPERSDARIPSRAEFDIRRQAGVDEALDAGDRPQLSAVSELGLKFSFIERLRPLELQHISNPTSR
jgi:hypothetical protein